MKSIRSGLVAATIATMMAAGTAVAAQPGAAHTQFQPAAGRAHATPQRLAYNGAGMPTARTTYGAMGSACPTPQVSSQPSHTGSDNGPPTFTPWLNITNGQ